MVVNEIGSIRVEDLSWVNIDEINHVSSNMKLNRTRGWCAIDI